MSQWPGRASVVVIGAGIMGNSLAYHLALRGWRDVVLLDKGPLPNPGGSTGHASNFSFPVEHSKALTRLPWESREQYLEMGVYTQSGGIELARTPERLQELKRRVASARAWGVAAELVTPRQVKELVPFVDTDIILGGFWCPPAGVIDPLEAGTIMRQRARDMGALTVLPGTEVVAVPVRSGRVRGVLTNRGEIQAEAVVIACGVWSPRIGRMAGAFIPLVPMVHQMISVGPIPLFEGTQGELEYPIIRDMDALMYERQSGSDLQIGTYAHRPMPFEPDDIPSLDEAKLSPTELPFTQQDFDPSMEKVLELMPEILGDRGVGIRHAINGLLSETPDGAPVLGETPEVKGLWSAAAVWVRDAAAVGRILAEWMTEGGSSDDLHALDIARFHEFGRTQAFVRGRASEGFHRFYGIVHPLEQWKSGRNLRLSPFHDRLQDLGAVFLETAGWERAQWYQSNARLLEEYADRIAALRRPNGWDARWWSPIIPAEHLALRDRVGLVDLSSFTVLDVVGPGALASLQRLAVAQIDVPVGKAVYTPLLGPGGGFRSDLTITRLAEDAFRVVTAAVTGGMDRKWLHDHLPGDGQVQLHDRTSALCTVCLWGPRARDVLSSVAQEDVSNRAFPFATARELTIGEVGAWALRLSYVGELGWELHAPMERGRRLWDILWEAGQPFGVVPVGLGVVGSTARLEKSYRFYGHELTLEYDPVEAGLARPKVKSEEFIGRDAYLRAREQGPAALLCTLTLDDPASPSGEPRYMLGNEPILDLRGEPIQDRKGRRSYVTSAGSGPSLGKHLLMAYLPPEHARVGARLAVEYFGERYPVSVGVVGSTPLFDPDNARMKA